MDLSSADVDLMSRLILDLCGIALDESKAYLIEHRLAPVAVAGGCTSFSDLYNKVTRAPSSEFANSVIDAITTNETLFFRDTTPFKALENRVVPDLVDGRAGSPYQKRLRIWSAACSTGQEPYSVAMILCDLFDDIDTWDIQITATDISNAAIAQASRGVFNKLEIQRGMRPGWLDRFFRPVDGGWQIQDKVRSMVQFRRMNLLKPFASIGTFDIVFCRNVAIYFAPPARDDLFFRLGQVVVPGGFVFLSAAEAIDSVCPEFKQQLHCGALYYQKA